MKNIVQELYKPALTESKRAACESCLLNHLYASQGLNTTYGLSYAFFELLNFLHVILQMKLIDVFLGGEFSSYGFQVLRFINQVDPMDRIDPMAKIFPKMAKCTFHRFGPSGSVQRYD